MTTVSPQVGVGVELTRPRNTNGSIRQNFPDAQAWVEASAMLAGWPRAMDITPKRLKVKLPRSTLSFFLGLRPVEKIVQKNGVGAARRAAPTPFFCGNFRVACVSPIFFISPASPDE